MSAADPKEGLLLKRNSKGFFVTIQQNQHKIAVLGGYNNVANAQKGLRALYRLLKANLHPDFTDPNEDKFELVDLTRAKKGDAKIVSGRNSNADPYRHLGARTARKKKR